MDMRVEAGGSAGSLGNEKGNKTRLNADAACPLPNRLASVEEGHHRTAIVLMVCAAAMPLGVDEVACVGLPVCVALSAPPVKPLREVAHHTHLALLLAYLESAVGRITRVVGHEVGARHRSGRLFEHVWTWRSKRLGRRAPVRAAPLP